MRHYLTVGTGLHFHVTWLIKRFIMICTCASNSFVTTEINCFVGSKIKSGKIKSLHTCDKVYFNVKCPLQGIKKFFWSNALSKCYKLHSPLGDSQRKLVYLMLQEVEQGWVLLNTSPWGLPDVSNHWTLSSDNPRLPAKCQLHATQLCIGLL